MNRMEAHKSIRSHFESIINNIQKQDKDGNVIAGETIRYALDNDVLTPEAKCDEEWIRFLQNHNITTQTSIGNPHVRFRTDGTATWQLYVPQNRGAERFVELVNIIRNSYLGKKTAEGVYFESIHESPDPVLNKEHYILNMVIEFTYDERT